MNKLTCIFQSFEAATVLFGCTFSLELVEMILLPEEKGAI